ncbi:type II toxin-antitoxin system toxin DNA ADP-ribosyl transferase DarT [Kribbella ginsengisoli]
MPTKVFHFTRVEHLSSIVESGLLSDSRARAAGLMQIEVGQQSIKQRRAETPVHVGPGGVVADYTPFYYAPRSPMMHNIHSGKVPSYQDGTDRLIYLATTTQQLVHADSTWVATDRNAVLKTAEFSLDDARVTDMIDWQVMTLEPCIPVADHPDRIERRMAEFLVHDTVPFGNLLAIGVKSPDLAAEVDQVLEQHGSSLRALVRPAWYF